ncbi:MAG: DUF2807 domain-containing protein [Flavobacterium sp.]|nr:DUF2807 domain-containing protein [Flavobacterium sp.]
MKKIGIVLVVLLVFISCEKPSDCVESTGDIFVKEVEVTAFNRLEVHPGIAVVITEGTEYKVQIQTGENLMENIEVRQEGTNLILRDNTTCNWVREFGQTTVYITAPNLDEIYSKTERTISTNGALTFDLKIVSFDSNADGLEGAGTGDFIMQFNSANLEINSNNVSRFYLSGTISNLATFNFYAGDSRIEAENLIAQKIHVFHRGTNDMTVFPVQSITGNLYSTGNLICKNYPVTPPNITTYYQGQVIFN